jgi:hypothetical protein
MIHIISFSVVKSNYPEGSASAIIDKNHNACGIAIGGEIMGKIKKKDIEEIKKVIEEEFPDDPALQHVHIARKIIAKEAELKRLSFLEYIKSQEKGIEDVR